MSDLSKLAQSIEKDIGDILYDPTEKIEAIATGSLSLDYALGIGGYAKGRIVDVFGMPSSGKSLLTMLAIKELQKKDGIACYIDAEHSFSSTWAKKLGVDPSKMLIPQPDTGEDAFNIIVKCCESGNVPLVIVDSVPALLPSATLDREIADGPKIGDVAALMSWGIKKILKTVYKSKTVVIFINQLRSKIGNVYGNPEEATGGLALKFYAAVRLDVGVVGSSKIMDGANVLGHRIRVKVIKNKVATPYKHAEFNLYLDSGIDNKDELADLAFESGIISAGAAGWFEYDGKKYQGKPKLLELLSDKGMYDKLLGAVNEQRARANI